MTPLSPNQHINSNDPILFEMPSLHLIHVGHAITQVKISCNTQSPSVQIPQIDKRPLQNVLLNILDQELRQSNLTCTNVWPRSYRAGSYILQCQRRPWPLSSRFEVRYEDQIVPCHPFKFHFEIKDADMVLPVPEVEKKTIYSLDNPTQEDIENKKHNYSTKNKLL